MIFLLLICLLFASVSGDTTTITLTDDKPSYNWNPSTAESISIESEEGYQIEIVVLTLSLDGAMNNYLTVQSSAEDANNLNEMMFTYLLNTPLVYFYNANKVLAEYVGTSTSNKISIQFNRKGHALTTITTQSTSTTEALPTPSSETSSTITEFIYGRSANEYDQATVSELRDALAGMGQQYCSVQSCPLNGTISTNNIIIQTIQKCPVLWEDHDTCVRLTFRMPVNILEQYSDQQLWEGYQFNQQHLQIMWNTYAEEYMGNLGLYLYPIPNIDTIFKHKLIVFSFVLVFFIIVIIIVRSIHNKAALKRINHDNDDVSIVNPTSRTSVASLTPHYLQQVPPIFSSDFPLYSDEKNHNDNYGEINESFSEEFDPNDYRIDMKVPETITIIGDLEEMKDSGA